MSEPIDTFYPGLRIWARFFRIYNAVIIEIYDREYSTDEPFCIIPGNQFALDSINELGERGYYILPGLTKEESKIAFETGILPDGYRTAAFIYKGNVTHET